MLAEVDRMRDAVHALRGGRRDKLSLCVDALFPPRALRRVRRSAARELSWPRPRASETQASFRRIGVLPPHE